MSNTTRILVLVAEAVLALATFLPSGALQFFVQPFKRGFFCNDQSLMHPFRGNTISTALLAVLSFIIPLTVFVAIELLIAFRRNFGLEESASEPLFCGRRCPGSVVSGTRHFFWLTFTIGVTMMLTDITKYSIGRLRPHFFAVCGFNPAGRNCTGGFITNFSCAPHAHLKEARLSFPSGHASVAAASMAFCVLYIHFRLRVPGLASVKPFLQAVLAALAVLCACSRVSDYMHHWSDVLAGLALGIAVAITIVFGVTDLPKQKEAMTYDMQLQAASNGNLGLKELGTTMSVVDIP